MKPCVQQSYSCVVVMELSMQVELGCKSLKKYNVQSWGFKIFANI